MLQHAYTSNENQNEYPLIIWTAFPLLHYFQNLNLYKVAFSTADLEDSLDELTVHEYSYSTYLIVIRRWNIYML